MKNKNKLVQDIAVKLKSVSKTYTLHHEKPTFIEQLLKFSKKEQFNALNNIDLTIYKGEKIGIIGSNGSGKTTILKIISKITTHTKGSVYTAGKVISLIELTAGFHPDLTGEENIYLNGLLVGMSRKEIEEKFQKIIEFADIGQFIDAPLYTYSDGMKLRLGFSIAIHADPDILVLDEGITAGDIDFQKKSGDKIEEFFRENKTIIVVTHTLEYLIKHCGRIIWIDKGFIVGDGGMNIISDYLNL